MTVKRLGPGSYAVYSPRRFETTLDVASYSGEATLDAVYLPEATLESTYTYREPAITPEEQRLRRIEAELRRLEEDNAQLRDINKRLLENGGWPRTRWFAFTVVSVAVGYVMSSGLFYLLGMW